MTVKLPNLLNGVGKCEIDNCDNKMFCNLNGLWICNECLVKYHNKTQQQERKQMQKRMQFTRKLIQE